VFLFDVEADPTETTDLAAAHPDMVAQLMERLMVYVNKSIPQQNFPKDPHSDPAQHGGVWTPWVGDPNPAHCQAVPVPPPPPPVPCGGDGSEGDAEFSILSGGQCVASGWCSGANFQGPPRTAEVFVDGIVVGTQLANGPRKIAGLHGFSIQFNCTTLSSGDHKVEMACKCADPSLPPEPLRAGPNGSEICTHGPPARVVQCPHSI